MLRACIQGGGGLLEDQPQPAASHGAQGPLVQTHQVAAAQPTSPGQALERQHAPAMRLSIDLVPTVDRQVEVGVRGIDTVDIDDLTPAQEAVIAESPNDDVADVRAAIFSLEDDYREPLVLQVLMGYSTKEIAELMELGQGAVLTRLHRARHKLREAVDFEAGDAGTLDKR